MFGHTISWLVCLFIVHFVNGFDTIDKPAFDFNSIGNKLQFVGNFDTISFYNYTGEENLLVSNVSSFDLNGNDLYYQDNNVIYSIARFDGPITLIEKYGDDSFVVVGDFNKLNYTSKSNNSVSVSSPLFYNSSSNTFTNLDKDNDIDGTINAVYGDLQEKLIYLGGKFTYKNTYGAAVYNFTSGSLNTISFKGFNKNSVVNSISRAGDDSIIFGGYFYSLGVPELQFTNQSYYLLHKSQLSTNSTSSYNETEEVAIQTEQQVSFKYASISADNTDSSHSSPDDIICPSSSNNWLSNSNQLGAWLATLPFSVAPSKIRLYNSKIDNSGVKMFRLYTSPSNSIMNLTYIDPKTNELATCDAWCPLYSHSDLSSMYSNIDDNSKTNVSFNNDGGIAASLSWSNEYQDFGFVNDLNVNFMNFHIVEYYGSSAGLNGVQMFTTQILTFANNTLNSGNCDSAGNTSYSETTGSGWEVSITGHYMANKITDVDSSISNKVGVTFYPNITYSGNYSIDYLTPGCQEDGTCDDRGTVDVTLYDENNKVLKTFTSAQTNQFAKIENIWDGHLNVTDGRPKIVVQVSSDSKDLKTFTFVADKIATTVLGVDDLLNSTNSTLGRVKTNSSISFNTSDYKIPINGLFEYSLKNFTSFPLNSDYNFSTSDFENKFVGNSSVNQYGAVNLSNSSVINALEYLNSSLFVAGDFSSEDGSNLVALSLDSSLDKNNNLKIKSVKSFNDGLNSEVKTMRTMDQELVIGGDFNNTISNASNLKSLSGSSDNNALTKVAVVSDDTITSFASGVANSKQVSSLGAITVNGVNYLAMYDEDSDTVNVWDTSSNKWFSNDDFNSTGLYVNVTASSSLSKDDGKLLSGHISSLGLVANGVAVLNKNNVWSTSGIDFGSDAQISNILYINDTLQVIGGKFTTKNSSNLIVLNTKTNEIKGFDDEFDWNNATINSISKDSSNSYLFVGLNGIASHKKDSQKSNIFVYDLRYGNITIPGSITKSSSVNNAKINAFYYYEKESKLLVGGDFDTASSMSCTSFCFYDMIANRWENDANNGFSSGVVNYMNETDSNLFMTGTFSLDGSSNYFATYDLSSKKFSLDTDLYTGSSSSVSKRDTTGISGEVKKYILVDGKNSKSNRILVLGEKFVSGYNKSSWVRVDQLNGELDSSSTFTKFQLISTSGSTKSDKSSKSSTYNEFFNAKEQTLLVTGNIKFTGYNNLVTAAAIFNGTNWLPYMYTTTSDGSSPSIKDFLVNKAISMDTFEDNIIKKVKLDRGWIVFIGLALSLGTMMLLALLALLIIFCKRKFGDNDDESNQRLEEDEMIQTVPPDQLLNEMDEFKFTSDKKE